MTYLLCSGSVSYSILGNALPGFADSILAPLCHAAERAPEEANNRPTGEHAQDIDDRDNGWKGSGQTLIKIPERDLLVVLNSKNNDGGEDEQQDE